MNHFFLLVFLAVLASAVSAWTKEDHEIFDLVTALETAEGKGTTFYSWLDVPSSASTNEIAKAYRKKSMALHPDKNPGVKGIHDRFARLGVISTILRNKEARERYDFFYKNGVPKWRGTGYYYSRFRPGLGTVCIFLTIITSGLQYVVQWMNYKRDVARIERIMSEARAAAWGPKMIPIEGKRKVKVNLGGGRRVDEDGHVVEGKVIDMVVEGSAVYILEATGELEALEISAAIEPSVKSTWFISLAISSLRKFRDGICKRAGEDKMEGSDDEMPGTGVGSTGEGKGRAPVGKTGGRRRGTRKR